MYDISNFGNDWVFKIIIVVGEKEVKFILGIEFDIIILDGRLVKVCVYIYILFY